MEDEILDLPQAVDIAFFLEATSEIRPGPYDIAFVEGSVTTPHEIERIKEIRREAGFVVALGTCATAGGIQALRNVADSAEYAETVYPHPEYLDYLETATPISDHIPVDLELWGCPVNKVQVLEVITALLQNRRPNLPPYSVCLECKQNNTICVLVAQGIPCLGPVTQAGCGGVCPSVGRGCYGCFGPLVQGNFDSLVPLLKSVERYPGETRRLLSHVSNYAPAFQAAADSLIEEEKRS
jgi:coenzyme F420-reducing hydrogenase gamma subunit